MIRCRARATLFALLCAVVVTVALPPSPASASSTAGKLIIKGPGSVYSGGGSVVSESVKAGATATFELRVVNYGSTPAQFKLYMGAQTPAPRTLTVGSVDVAPFAQSPEGYFTPPLAPGKYLQLELKVKIPFASPPPTQPAWTTFDLQPTDGSGTSFSFAWAYTIARPPSAGNEPAEVFARQGSQFYVGGAASGHMATSPAIGYRGSTQFDIRFQNDGVAPARIKARLDVPEVSCFTVTAKRGTRDITGPLVEGTYATPVLDVHGTEAITVTVRRTSPFGCGPWNYFNLNTSEETGSNHNLVQLIVPIPATASGPQ